MTTFLRPAPPQRGRLLAIGDVHADPDALVRIMLGLSLVDVEGDWSGSSDRLVLLGDLNDRGPDSVGTMNLVMRWQKQAVASGGRIDVLLGNHEMLAVQGDFRYARPAELLEWDDFWLGDEHGLEAVYRHDAPWARWLRTRPALLVAEQILFVHAGLPRSMLTINLGDIDDIVRQWLHFFQGVGEEPVPSSRVFVSQAGNGPLWFDGFRLRDDLHAAHDDWPTPDELVAFLTRINCRLMVVGHRPSVKANFRIVYPHPVYGRAVATIDTGISRYYGGRLSAALLSGAGVRQLVFARGEHELPLTKRLLTQSRQP